MGTRRVCSAAACILAPALALLPGREDQLGRAGASDLRSAQVWLADGARVPSRPGAPEGPGRVFAQCGEVWEEYEQVVWSRNPDNVVLGGIPAGGVACASAHDNVSIGICRRDNIGHDHWEYCASPPSSRCDGYGKLFFVRCSDVARAAAPAAAAHGHAASARLMAYVLDAPLDAGATSIEAPAEALAGLSVGNCLLLEGGGNSEAVCVAGFGPMLLVEPTTFAYPAGSTITLQEGRGDGASGSSPAAAAGHPRAQGGPHVCALSGECYDIQAPSEYTLLRLPYSEQEPATLKLSAELGTDGVRPCGLFARRVTLSGSWLDDQVVQVRPYTRNVGGSNWAGNQTLTNFSLRLGDGPWRSFARVESPRLAAVVGQLTVRFVWRERRGPRAEAQSLEFLLGEGGRPAVLTVSQASHQALDLEMEGVGRLGYSRMGGVLGTEGHSASIEEAARQCRAAALPAAGGRRPAPTPLERASTLRASWA